MLIAVESVAQAETMRQIRNACRTFMTNNKSYITEEEQQNWFLHLHRDVTRPLLWSALSDEHVVTYAGYGLIRMVDDKWWVSGGLLPDWRGKGHGKQLFAGLARYVHLLGYTCWLDVWETNERARRTYESIGFVEVERADGRITMRKDKR